jgi:hypothetical protein
VPGGWVGRSVGVGSGSDLSEEPVYQGFSRPRWIKESSLSVLPDPHLFQVTRSGTTSPVITARVRRTRAGGRGMLFYEARALAA